MSSWYNVLTAALVNAEDAHGMPVGIQVMCPWLQEEQVLGLMEAISEALAQVPAMTSP